MFFFKKNAFLINVLLTLKNNLIYQINLHYSDFFCIFGTPLPCGRVPSEGTTRQCRAFRQGFSPKKNYSSRYYFFAP